MTRLIRLPALLAFAGLLVAAAAPARADFILGTQGLTDIGKPTVYLADGTTQATLSTASVFKIGNLITTAAGTQSFTNTPTYMFGTSTLNLATSGSFSFGNAAFGMFTAATVAEQMPTSTAVSSSRTFVITGTFVSGSFFGAATTNTASFNFTFTANGTASTGISYVDSGVLSVPAVVPEPASVALLSIGLVGLAGVSARRRASR